MSLPIKLTGLVWTISHWLIIVSYLIAIAFVGCVLVIYMIYLRRGQSLNKMTNYTTQTKIKFNVLSKLTIFTLVMNLLTNMFVLFPGSTLSVIQLSPKSCKFTSILMYLSWAYYKGGLYLIYVARLHAVYGSTAWKIKGFISWWLYSVTISFFIIFTIIVAVYAFYLPEEGNYVFYSYTNHCEYIFPVYVNMYVGFMEVTFPLITLYLFVRPLKNLWKQTKDDALLNLAIKCSLITGFMIFSSCFAVTVFTFVGGNFVTALDNMFNATSLLLYDKVFDQYYKRVFHRIHGRIYDKYKKLPSIELATNKSKSDAIVDIGSIDSKSSANTDHKTETMTSDTAVVVLH